MTDKTKPNTFLYVVTTFYDGYYDRTRTVGWFSNEQDAIYAVENNLHDIYENGYYRQVVIEQVEEGLYPNLHSQQFYIWEGDTYVVDRNVLELNKGAIFCL